MTGKPKFEFFLQILVTLLKFIQIFPKFCRNTTVVPKLVLVFSRRHCNAIYWNSNEAHVFCSSLSFQQAPTDICVSDRSQVAAGIMKTNSCAYPSGEREVQMKQTNKMGGRVANMSDFSVEVRNSENDPYFSRFLFRVWKFSDFLWILQLFDFLAIFRNEITTILTPSTSEGGKWGRWGWSRFSF